MTARLARGRMDQRNETGSIDAHVRARAGAARTMAISLAWCLAVGLSCPGQARADGAFPDAQNILVPAARPGLIVMATNFGVVFTEDGGYTWLWTCEQDANALGWLYQIGLAPGHRIFAVANRRLVFSDDLTCGWRIAGGALAGQDVLDAWVDRAVPGRVFALGVRCCQSGVNVYSTFASTDGGSTFEPSLYLAAVGDTITGIESSASDPQTIYMTLTVGPTYQSMLARSSDAGATWVLKDLTASLGMGNARLIAVDAHDAEKVFLLWNDPVAGQAVAVTEDGGDTASIRLPATSDGASIKGFAQTARGALLIATDLNGLPRLYRSEDGGDTFASVPEPPHIRGLSARGNVVYAATDNFVDGFALATSSDDGTTWVPVMSYGQLRAIAPCLKVSCQTECLRQAPLLWAAPVCQADAPGTRGNGACGCRAGAAPGNGDVYDRAWAPGMVMVAFFAMTALAARRRARSGGRRGQTTSAASGSNVVR